jgi:hypothetical protein
VGTTSRYLGFSSVRDVLGVLGGSIIVPDFLGGLGVLAAIFHWTVIA